MEGSAAVPVSSTGLTTATAIRVSNDRIVAAAKALKRAVELTSDEQRRPGRLLAAANAALLAGSLGQAQVFLAQALPVMHTPAERAQSLRLQASIPLAHGQAGESFRLLLQAARRTTIGCGRSAAQRRQASPCRGQEGRPAR